MKVTYETLPTRYAEIKKCLSKEVIDAVEATLPIWDWYHDAEFKPSIDDVVELVNKDLANANIEDEEEPKSDEPKKADKPQKKEAKKEPKPKAEPKVKTPKYETEVNYPSIQVRLSSRFCRLQGKPFDSSTKESAVRLLKALQKAIVNQEIRAEGHGEASAYAGEMRQMQKVLVKMANTACNASKNVDIEGIGTFVKIAKNEGSLKATAVMRSYVQLEGSDNSKRAKSLLSRVGKVLENGEAGKYEDILRQIQSSLTDFVEGRTESVEALPQTLDGIAGALDGTGQQSKKKTLVSANALCGTTFSVLPFTGKWAKIIGHPAEPYKVMIYGGAGSGKSTLALQFANYLATEHDQRVLYFASEEGIGYGLQEKLERLNIVSKNLILCSELPKDLTCYDVVFIDSVNHAGLEAEDLRRLPQSVSYVYVFQATKSGNFRGTNDYLHDVDASIRVESFRAYAEKNRFGASGECEVV